MPTLDDFAKYMELRKKLVQTSTNIITPSLGKGNHLHNSYLRISFISKTIDFLAYKSIFCKITKFEGSIIREAVCNTSWILNNLVSAKTIDMLLFEMSEGLGLLDRYDLGYVEVENPAHLLDNSKPAKIQQHLGFNYSLSEEGLLSYKNQEFQILLTNILNSNIGRIVSYVAVFLALVAIVVPFL